jgi:hypothetical protein
MLILVNPTPDQIHQRPDPVALVLAFVRKPTGIVALGNRVNIDVSNFDFER